MKFDKNQFLFFGLAAHLLAAFFSIGAHQCDEIFQVYEFAGYKLRINTASELPWEFHEQMRSGIQPFIVYAITKAFHSITVTNPFTISWIIRTLQSLFSFIVVVQFLSLFEKDLKEKYRSWLYGFGLLFWCLPYFHARFSSENFSATLFVFGLVLLLKNLQKQSFHVPVLLAGILFGISFESRFQICFMIVGLILWLLTIQKISFRFLMPLFFGLLLASGIGLLADHWLYDTWVLSWWNYLDLNLFKDKASQFGREPIYFFLSESFLQLIPPFSIIIVLFIVGFWIKFKKHVLTWITLPFILLHFFVAHKELRFLFPVLNFLPLMILYYFQSIEEHQNWFVRFLKTKFFLRFAITVNVLLLIYYAFKPADDTSTMLRAIYKLTDEKKVDLLFDGNDPYGNGGALHYFRNPNIKTFYIQDSIHSITHPNVYFFSQEFNDANVIIKNNAVFMKQFSSFPLWFKYLDFNGWVGRSDPFTIYRLAQLP